MVNNVIGVVNYVIAARPSLLNFVIADIFPGCSPGRPSEPLFPGAVAQTANYPEFMQVSGGCGIRTHDETRAP